MIRVFYPLLVILLLNDAYGHWGAWTAALDVPMPQGTLDYIVGDAPRPGPTNTSVYQVQNQPHAGVYDFRRQLLETNNCEYRFVAVPTYPNTSSAAHVYPVNKINRFNNVNLGSLTSPDVRNVVEFEYLNTNYQPLNLLTPGYSIEETYILRVEFGVQDLVTPRVSGTRLRKVTRAATTSTGQVFPTAKPMPLTRFQVRCPAPSVSTQ